MSEQTNDLLHLFSKLLRQPRFIMALRMEMMRHKFQERGNRKGARGLLVELWKQDGLTNAEIAEQLDIRPSSVTAQVKRLEEAELVERRADENDGRVSRVFLTDKGRAAESEREEAHDEVSESLFGSLSAEEQASLSALMKKLTDSFADDEFEGWGPFGEDGFDPRRMRQMGRDMHQMHREMRQNFQEGHHGHGPHGDFHNPWNFGQNSPKFGKGPKEKHENWDDF